MLHVLSSVEWSFLHHELLIHVFVEPLAFFIGQAFLSCHVQCSTWLVFLISCILSCCLVLFCLNTQLVRVLIGCSCVVMSCGNTWLFCCVCFYVPYVLLSIVLTFTFTSSSFLRAWYLRRSLAWFSSLVLSCSVSLSHSVFILSSFSCRTLLSSLSATASDYTSKETILSHCFLNFFLEIMVDF